MLQDFTAVVARIADLTHDVREIELQLEQPDGIAFKAGQFVTFKVPKPGLPRPVSRAYSIASPPSERCRVLLLFNRVPDGPGSTYLFGLDTASGRISEARLDRLACVNLWDVTCSWSRLARASRRSVRCS
jgi:NAD(P)H-flavin reductase